jgi:hypothetical protein
VNEFTERLIQVAYDECRQQRRGKKAPIALDDLLAQAGRAWILYRNHRIEEWADQLIAVCAAESRSDAELEELVCQMDYELVTYWNIVWEVPSWEPEDDDDRAQLRDEQSRFIAWGIAGLWWARLEGAEFAPILRYARDEVETWLAERREAERLVVEKRTRTGETVVQRRMFAT